MQDLRGRRDGVAGVDQGAVGKGRSNDATEGGRLVAGDVAVRARRKEGSRDEVAGVEDLGRLAEGIAGVERPAVGLRDDGPATELLLDPAQRGLHASLEQPEHDAQGEEVPGQVDLLGGHVKPLEGPRVERGDRDLEDHVRLEGPVAEGVRGVARLGQVRRREGVAVDDDRAARDQVLQVGTERRRVHGDEDVGGVARGVDVAGAEADLEAGDAGQRARGRPDLGRVVRQGADVVAEDGCGAGELGAGQLHPVAGIAGKPDGDAVQLLDRDVVALRGRHGTWRSSWVSKPAHRRDRRGAGRCQSVPHEHGFVRRSRRTDPRGRLTSARHAC